MTEWGPAVLRLISFGSSKNVFRHLFNGLCILRDLAEQGYYLVIPLLEEQTANAELNATWLDTMLHFVIIFSSCNLFRGGDIFGRLGCAAKKDRAAKRKWASGSVTGEGSTT